MKLTTPQRSCLGRLAFAAIVVVSLLGSVAQRAGGVEPGPAFRAGLDAYTRGDYAGAAAAFLDEIKKRPGSGALHNLGNAEWNLGRPGRAILAWEQALWLDPRNKAAENNARFARKTAQLESPELSWFEVVSTWLPVNWWAWITGASLWTAVAAGLLPGMLRWRKSAWHQGVAALSLAIFLLSLPAHLGIHTRARIGFVLQKDSPLRLTPTEAAQVLTRLAAGEPARVERSRGKYMLIRTSRGRGWVKPDQFGLTCPSNL